MTEQQIQTLTRVDELIDKLGKLLSQEIQPILSELAHNGVRSGVELKEMTGTGGRYVPLLVMRPTMSLPIKSNEPLM